MRAIEETTALVTGATDGLGRGVAERLAALGATVHLHGRDAARLAATRDGVARRPATTASSPTGPTWPRSTRCGRWPQDVERSTDALHVLVSNAGIGSGRPDATTREESRDGPSCASPSTTWPASPLTLRLLALLRRSAPARVVLVASLGQAPVDFDDVQLEHGYDGGRAYGQSKLAQITTGFELADRARGQRRHGHEPAPGDVHADEDRPRAGRPLGRHPRGGRGGDGPPRGRARARGRHGPVLRPAAGGARAHPQAYDAEARRRLWDSAAR